MEPTIRIRAAATALLDGMGLPRDLQDGAHPVDCVGTIPALDTPHRIVEGAAAALAAQALAVEPCWRLQGGPAQQVTIDMLQAAASLYPSRYQRQWGRPMPMMAGTELRHAFYRTADDRYFFPIGSYPAFRNATLDLLACANNTEAIARAIGRWRGDELEDAFAQRKLTGALVRSEQEWRSHPQGRALADTPVVEVQHRDGPPPAPRELRSRPLEGIRVLDASHVIAGPIVARTLAEQGAEVLRIGAPQHVDPLLQVMDTNIGKRSSFLDLRLAADARRMRELVREADVFIDSWRQGSLARLGFGPDDLEKLRPGLVHVGVSAYGQRGPWADRGGYEQVGQVVSGICHTEGGDGMPKVVPTLFLNDYVTGYLGAAGAAAALTRRLREGGSYRVHVSLARTSMWVQSLGLQARPSQPQDPFTLQPRLERRESPFGMLDHLPPVAALSHTPSRWDLPPTPLGAAPAAWIGQGQA
jgi:crotonobetainyl-CoA:carnitine CoA-transferase CaiB-like acyl-CoA transferase